MADSGANALAFALPQEWHEYQIDRPRSLPVDTVDIWSFELACGSAMIDGYLRTLSNEEILRSRRFVREKDRAEFIVSHGILRAILAQYCNITARQLRFVNGIAGKPSLAPSGALASPPNFNMAHSGGRMLLAVTSGRDVGVDIECERDEIHPLEIAARFFYGAEFDAIMACPDEERHAAFFRQWVAKEAVLKAKGLGLTLALDQFMIVWGMNKDLAHAHFFDPRFMDDDWDVRMLNCEPGWYAAVSSQTSLWTVSTQASAFS